MARRKMTDDLANDLDLPDLTPQQSKFVEGILKGLSASDAYRDAYDCSNSKPSTIWCEASKLTRHTSVAQWISAARQAGLGNPKVSMDRHIQRLERLEELCIISGNLGAAVQAEQLIGKASGHYVDQFRDVTKDPMESLREIEQLSPDLAEKLAKENGIEWPTRH